MSRLRDRCSEVYSRLIMISVNRRFSMSCRGGGAVREIQWKGTRLASGSCRTISGRKAILLNRARRPRAFCKNASDSSIGWRPTTAGSSTGWPPAAAILCRSRQPVLVRSGDRWTVFVVAVAAVLTTVCGPPVPPSITRLFLSTTAVVVVITAVKTRRHCSRHRA